MAACWNRLHAFSPRRTDPAPHSAARLARPSRPKASPWLAPDTASGTLQQGSTLRLCSADFSAGQRHRLEDALMAESRLLVRPFTAVFRARGHAIPIRFDLFA